MYFQKYSVARPGFGQWRGSRLGFAGGVSQGFGVPPITLPALPKVVSVTFRNERGTVVDPDNCCIDCGTPPKFGVGPGGVPWPPPFGRRIFTLGVGRSGTASNGMEMQFTIAGHRAGIEYEIRRVRRHSFWQRRGRTWTKLESVLTDTNDDSPDNKDECLTPIRNRIFVIDAPGYAFAPLPAPNGVRWPTSNPRVRADADATDMVFRASFAEWVEARSPAQGIPWTVISPGPEGRIFWYSTVWLVRDASNNWVLGPCSKISLGSLSNAALDSPPVCYFHMRRPA